MHAEVSLLLEAQKLDQELVELRRQIAQYPITWEKVKARYAKAKQRFEMADGSLKAHLENRTRIERELRENTELLRKYQLRQPMVRTQREIEALTSQMDSTRQTISALEKEGLEELERAPSLKNEHTASEAALKEAETFYRGEKERIRKAMAEKKAETEKYEAQRDKMLAKVSERTRSIYERAMKRWPGTGVVPVRGVLDVAGKNLVGGSCCGCNFQLLASDLMKVHEGKNVVTCTNCSRILSHDEDHEARMARATAGKDAD